MTAQDIAKLTLPQSYAYFEGYYPDDELPDGVNAWERCIEAIFRAIGRSDLVETFLSGR